MNAATKFSLTTYTTFEGFKLWGFRLVLNDRVRQQHPCWHTKREAVESARFHIDKWSKQAA